MQRSNNGKRNGKGSGGGFFEGFFCASKLNIKDAEKAERLTSLTAISAFRSRYRGTLIPEACFVFFRRSVGEVILHIHPKQQVCTPEDLAESVRGREQAAEILAIGFLSAQELEATRLEVERNFFLDLIARSFGADHKSDVSLIDFRDATIVPEGVTILKFVEDYGLEFCHR